MWTEVIYGEELDLDVKVRIRSTGHEAVISKISKPVTEHCLIYNVQPEDPNDYGGYWYFSHDFDVLK